RREGLFPKEVNVYPAASDGEHEAWLAWAAQRERSECWPRTRLVEQHGLNLQCPSLKPRFWFTIRFPTDELGHLPCAVEGGTANVYIIVRISCREGAAPRRGSLFGIECPGTGHLDRFVELCVAVSLRTGVAYQGKIPIGCVGRAQRPE